MHYKNGRPAKSGDKVFNPTTGVSGLLHSLNPGSQTCNGRVAQTSNNDPYVNIGDCLHADDIATASIPDSSTPAPAAPGATEAPPAA